MPEQQDKFEATGVELDDAATTISIAVKNKSEKEATCWVRPLFQDSDPPDFVKVEDVKPGATGYAKCPAPSAWKKAPGARFIRVEITVIGPGKAGTRSPGPTDSSTVPFRLTVKVKADAE